MIIPSIYSHLLWSVPKMTYKNFGMIRNFFPNLQYAWEKAKKSEFMEAGISREIIESIESERQKKNAESAWEDLVRYDMKILSIDEENYPSLLRNIHCPPFLLYYRGSIEDISCINLAVVGSRTMSYYGEQILEKFFEEFAMYSLNIVSGLAIGIDAAAHRNALKHGLRTFAILAHGLDRMYPTENTHLAKEITQYGAIISEYSPGTEPLKVNFPIRNRIIAGLSVGTLIVEAKEKSGALITAMQALDENREVFAVPGSIFHIFSRGTNNLIASGQAHSVLSGEDVLHVLANHPLCRREKQPHEEGNEASSRISQYLSLSSSEKKIIKLLKGHPIQREILQKRSKMAPHELTQILSLLELKNLIREVGNSSYTSI